MTMRMDLCFSRPLNADERSRLNLAVAPLATVRKLRVVDNGYAAMILGEALERETLLRALVGTGLTPESIIAWIPTDEPAPETTDVPPTGTESP